MTEKLDDKNGWESVTIVIPPELKGYGPNFQRFFDAMVFKLRRNAHKGKWENLPLIDAERALEREMSELITALDHGNTVEILTEAADVANQALIVADIALEARHVQKI